MPRGLFLEELGTWVVRRDPLGFWVALDRELGVRMRLSFSPSEEAVFVPYRSTWPELVDLRITDRCDAACPWCYQGSTPPVPRVSPRWHGVARGTAPGRCPRAHLAASTS